MTSELNFDAERAAEAHSASFALITSLLSTGLSTGPSDVRATLRAYVDPEADPLVVIGKLADIVEVLTWHAAGNLLAATRSVDAALATIRAAAIDQEIFLRDERGDG